MNQISTQVMAPEKSFFRRGGEAPTLGIVFAIAAVLRLWKLDNNKMGNAYYAAAVRSMVMNWHNFFYVSFDPAGIVTVDKPPVALWLQALSAKLLGFSSFSILLPGALEGCISVLLLYFLVRRHFSVGAALIAALAMALGPLSVAVDRYNNVDGCLVFVLLLAAWAITLATERGSRWFLFLAMALVGIGFNTKMMAAFVALPAFYFLYFVGAPLTWRRKLINLVFGSVVLAVVSLSWPLAVDLTPPDQRPFVGSTQDNSMLSLSLGWNGFQRLMRRGRMGQEGARRGPRRPGQWPPQGGRAWQGQRPGPGGRDGVPGMGTGTPGPFRLAQGAMATQISWFFPLALIGLLAAARFYSQGSPLSPKHQALVLWTGWSLVYAAVFSFMRGAMHTYYLVLMVPALCALLGIGLEALWRIFQKEFRSSFLLPLAFLLCGLWQLYLLNTALDWKPFLSPILLWATAIAVAPLFILAWVSERPLGLGRWATAAVALGVLTLFMAPTLWALSPVLAAHGEGSPEADIALISGTKSQGNWGGEGAMDDRRLIAFLRAHHQGERYFVAAQNVRPVQSIIIETGETAISLGGFMGADPAVTLAQFTQMVEDKQLRYVLVQQRRDNPESLSQTATVAADEAGPGVGGWGQGAAGAEIANWIRLKGQPVDPALWRPASWKSQANVPNLPVGAGPGAPEAESQIQGGAWGGRMGDLQLYDLRPERIQLSKKGHWRHFQYQ